MKKRTAKATTDSVLASFHEPTREWFRRSFDAPTRAQALGWPSILAGRSTLILAPTGSGKTLAAFLAAIDRLMWEPEPDKLERCRVLYVSPLKALAVDVERNLRAPIAGISAIAALEGVPIVVPTVDVRSGDTPAAARARMLRHPPDVLITTPESLYLLLTSQAREILDTVETVIIDEIHSLVPTKRGVHLFLSLERLEEMRRLQKKKPLQRIGLSATQRPLEEVARFLGGRDRRGFRPVDIIDAGERKTFDLRVEVPVEDMSQLGDPVAVTSGAAAGAPGRKSIWPSIHPRLLELIAAHRSTLIFVNSRRLAERLASALNELHAASTESKEVTEIVLAHHGSVARDKRMDIEDRLKRGLLPAIIATSSLELGIDMGAIDLVVQIEGPPSIASAMQRIGRAGHSVGEVSNGVIFPKFRGDLLACAAAVQKMLTGEVEETFYPRNALDVLAQQLVAICASSATPLAVEDVFQLVRRAAPYAELPRSAFEGVLDMLSGRYPSDEFAELRPRLTWDRVGGTLRAREGATRLAVINGGTIADRGLYGVFLVGSEATGAQRRSSERPESRSDLWRKPGSEATGAQRTKGVSRRVGELDEEMVFESRVGDVFLLGASSWRIEEITHDQVLVSPAPGEPGKMPFWHGDRPGRPVAFGQAIGALARHLVKAGRVSAEASLRKDCCFDERAARNLVDYLFEQTDATGVIPSDQTIVVERFIDEIGDHRVCVLSPFGARLHAPWATAVTARLEARFAGEIDSIWSDDGMVFRLPESDTPPDVQFFLPSAAEIEDLVVKNVAGTSLFAARFRECAARSLLLPRKHPTKRTPLWAQRKRAADLLAVASRHASFPIVLETYREVLRDVFDLPSLVETLRKIEQRRIRVVTVDSAIPSPYASSLLFSYVANFIYDGDSPLAERRAQVLGIDHAQLRELLGEAELRELLDPMAIEEHERTLQRIPDAQGRYAIKSADGLHDLLLSIGELSSEEIARRTIAGTTATSLIEPLVSERRIVAVRIAREQRFVAAEDVSRYRDALGIVPPSGLPQSFLEPTKDALGELLARFARTHGPFVVETPAARFGIAPAAVLTTLERLAERGRVVQGEFLRGGRSREWCDAEVLRALRRKSLARLRKEVEPVAPAAFGRFLPEWQGIVATREGEGDPKRRASFDALLAAIERLQGAPIPASVLESEVLPARVPGYRPADLDALCASGEIVWGGVEPIGPNDGRIALYLAEHEPLLAPLAAPLTESKDATDLISRVRDLLARRGAIFFAEIVREIGGFPAEIVDTLWTMVWSHEVTNDTLAPLRAYVRGKVATSRGQRPGRTVPRGRFAGPPGSEGRWSLRAARWSRIPTDTERRSALARALLDRYGVLTREAVHAEGIATGFTAVYDVLRAMEEAGKIRRGYFIEGRGATQFALPGAVDRLRTLRDDSHLGADSRKGVTRILAATDPANPYGAALAWPKSQRSPASETREPREPHESEISGARPQRAAGAFVVLYEGALIGYLGRSEQSLLTFLPSEEPERGAAISALTDALGELVVEGRRRAVLIATIDGQPAAHSPLARPLEIAGFTAGFKGFLRRRRPGEGTDAGG